MFEKKLSDFNIFAKKYFGLTEKPMPPPEVQMVSPSLMFWQGSKPRLALLPWPSNLVVGPTILMFKKHLLWASKCPKIASKKVQAGQAVINN